MDEQTDSAFRVSTDIRRLQYLHYIAKDGLKLLILLSTPPMSC